MHPDEFSPNLFRVGAPALKIWDLLRYSTQDDLIGGGPRSCSEKVLSAGANLERVGFDWIDDERIGTKKRKRSGSTGNRDEGSRQVLYEFEMNLERMQKAILDLRDLSTGSYPRGRDGRRASSARRSDMKMLRDEVGGLSVAIVLIMVDYILLLSVDALVPWITERAADILQNSKLGVNERLDEVNRLVRGEYYRIVNPSKAPQRNKSKSGRNQPPRAPSPPRQQKGKFDDYRRRRDVSPSSRSDSWQETSVSSYDDFRGRQAGQQQHHHHQQPRGGRGRPAEVYSATSSMVSSSEDFEEVPELSYESSEDDAYYYYDETASATSSSTGFDTLGGRVDDRWSCDSWHDRQRNPNGGRRGSTPYDRHIDEQRMNNHGRQQQQQQYPGARGREKELGGGYGGRGEREREHTPPPRFSQTKFHGSRDMAGEQQRHRAQLPPRTPQTPRTPQGFGFGFPEHPYSAGPKGGFAPPPQVRHFPPPPQPRFAPQSAPPPQRRFSHSYVPMPDAPRTPSGPPRNVRFAPDPVYRGDNGRELGFNGTKFPAVPITMVPGRPIPMPTSFASSKMPPPTPSYTHPRRVPNGAAPGPLPRSQTWPPSGGSKRQTFGGFGIV